MYNFLKLVCTFALVIVLSSDLISQYAFFTTAEFRVARLPYQSFAPFPNSTILYEITQSDFTPGLKLGAGFKMPIQKKITFEAAVSYSITGTSYSTRHIRESDYVYNPLTITNAEVKGPIFLLEVSPRITRLIGTIEPLEIVMGVRLSSFYIDNRRADYVLTKRELITNAAGDPEYVLRDSPDYYWDKRQPGFALHAWPEIRVRTWALNKGMAGLEFSSGISMSSIFTRRNKLKSYHIGIGIIQRWDRQKKK